jgi:hypothetical protein
MLTLGVASLLAVILGAVGIFGLLSYVVADRTSPHSRSVSRRPAVVERGPAGSLRSTKACRQHGGQHP